MQSQSFVGQHVAANALGQRLERELSDAKRDRMRAAFRAAGPAAVGGFRQVLEAMMDTDMRRQYEALRDRTT